MPRTVTLWRLWDGHDMAQSDHFYTTRREAEAERERWYGGCDPTDEAVHLEPVEVVMTKEGVAWALTHLPHR